MTGRENGGSRARSRRSPRVVEIFLLVVLLAAIGWVAQIRRKPPAPAGGVAVGPGSGFGPLASITFPAGRDSIVVTRMGDDDYTVIHPVRDRGAPLFLAEVIRSINSLKAERVLTAEDAGGYGLGGPGPALRLVDTAGRTWTLRLGEETPEGSLLYARLGDPSAPLLLLDRYTVRKYFQPELRTVRDPSATAMRTGPIDSVAALVPGRELHAARVGRELWRVRAPVGLDADPAALNGVVRHLRDPNITDFPPASAARADLGLDPPRASWILYQGARRDTVRVGYGTPDQRGIYILPAHRATPAVLSSEHFRRLVGGWPELVDRRLLRIAVDSVTVVEFPGRPYSFHREAGEWRRFPGGDRVLRGAALDQDLANLASLRWVRYPLPEEPPPQGAARLAVRLATPARAETLHLTAAADSLGWARATRAPRWGRVSAAAWIAWSYRAERGE